MSQHRFLTSADLRQRYSRTDRTLARWIKNPPNGFPLPVKVNGRHLWPLEQIEEFERKLASNVAAKAA
jgi:hypothetical protein